MIILVHPTIIFCFICPILNIVEVIQWFKTRKAANLHIWATSILCGRFCHIFNNGPFHKLPKGLKQISVFSLRSISRLISKERHHKGHGKIKAQVSQSFPFEDVKTQVNDLHLLALIISAEVFLWTVTWDQRLLRCWVSSDCMYVTDRWH